MLRLRQKIIASLTSAPLGLVITFEEYQVAPYAVGYQQVMIPDRDFFEILANNGPVSAFSP